MINICVVIKNSFICEIVGETMGAFIAFNGLSFLLSEKMDFLTNGKSF